MSETSIETPAAEAGETPEGTEVTDTAAEDGDGGESEDLAS